MISKQEARSLIRKAVKRVPEGEEIRHLNIMPMMDIMTVLLVAFIMTATESAALTVGDVDLPASKTNDPLPEKAVTLTIAKDAILVEGQPLISIKNGAVDPSEKEDGALGIRIPKLSNFLGAVRVAYERGHTEKGKAPPPENPELLLIADQHTPYKLLFEVIVSSRHEDAGFKRFRMILLQAHEVASSDGP